MAAAALSQEQMIYAADDVLYLVPLYEALQSALKDSGRLSWFSEDMALRGHYVEPDPGAYFAQVKRAWQLSQRELARLKALCRWRKMLRATLIYRVTELFGTTI